MLAQRRPSLHGVLDYADEAFALMMFLLENHSLNNRDASFAESLYEIKRTQAVRGAGKGGLNEPATAPLSTRSRWLSLFFLVLFFFVPLGFFVCIRW